MRTTLTRNLSRYQQTFNDFAPGQKVVAIVGTLGLLLAGFLVFRWAATPDYSPLFSNMSSKDASAVIEKLEADGIPYEIGGGGGTVMVPQDQVYSTRIALSGEGLPTSSDGGYSLLDSQSISASQFQEQTAFKRAMEGELSRTIGAIDGIDTAVVHLAMPEKEVFADEQDPTTASVLVGTRAGSTLQPNQVQAIVHLVASSIDGLDPAKVTVADSTGQVLSTDDGAGGAGANSRSQEVADYQDQMTGKIQAMLDRVVGPGNSTVTVSAELDFDKSVQESKTYSTAKGIKPLSESTQTEEYTGPAGGNAETGVVGPDGQMDTGVDGAGTGANGDYKKESKTSDNAVNTVVERREAAPGTPTMKTVSVVLDSAAARDLNNEDVADLVATAAGINEERSNGAVEVQSMPFDRSAEEAAAKELAAAAAAEEKANLNQAIRNGALGGVVALMLALAWFKGRKRAKARAQATSYVVEQLRNESAARAAVPVEPPAAVLALESTEQMRAEETRAELAALVERQPEEVAALLRGWLVQS
ncbi:flagellar basal-body MS-ring/collar protein FliF [uncultured Nocardioides sp.]|uniref:Flagellar M-ring protein n=1 Tax=uncultured Nocardioides sp. TaxID=198441 RepID=A0A6J4N574_9ACTN|nr:flagellar basal-body MS-ring/collar protein FliF [uncultured Nocardioides sp.]CAA9373524.1 MAG: Flagellar M-ring protein FliF [uncultured Nocardioides sp.]